MNQVCKAFTSEDVSVFIADNSISFGESIPLKIEAAIKECDLFVVLWSSNAKTSDWVQQEIGIAKGNQKPILPLVLQRGLKLPPFIRELKYLPVYSNPYKAYQLLQNHIFQKAKKKKTADSLIGIGIAVTIMYMLSKNDSTD